MAEVMGVVSAVADVVVVLFSLTIGLGVPLIDAQAVLAHDAYPAPLQDLKRWYATEFDDYLMAHLPAFFHGHLCLELAFLWPLNVATVYGVLSRRRWATTTSLMVGVTTLTSLNGIVDQVKSIVETLNAGLIASPGVFVGAHNGRQAMGVTDLLLPTVFPDHFFRAALRGTCDAARQAAARGGGL